MSNHRKDASPLPIAILASLAVFSVLLYLIDFTLAFVVAIFTFGVSYIFLSNYISKHNIKMYSPQDIIKKVENPLQTSSVQTNFQSAIILLLLMGFIWYYSSTTTTEGETYKKLEDIVNKYNKLVEEYNTLLKSSQQLQSQNQILQSNLTNLYNENLESIKPPYIISKGREVKTVFKKTDGETVTWTLPYDSFESAISLSYYKLDLLPKILPDYYTAYNNLVNYCNVIVQISPSTTSQCNDIIDSSRESLAKIEEKGAQYINLKLDDGKKVKVMDFREYVQPKNFKDVIDTIYDPNKTDAQNIREIWNIVQQLTSYSYDFKETPRYPLATLSEGGGDCEDTAILVASLLKAVPKNWKVKLVYMDADDPSDPKTSNHVIVKVDTGTYSTYIETTNSPTLNPWGTQVAGWEFEV